MAPVWPGPGLTRDEAPRLDQSSDGLTLVPLPAPSMSVTPPSLSRDSEHYLITSSDDGNYHQPKSLIDHNDNGGPIIVVCPNIMPCLIAIVAGFPLEWGNMDGVKE